MKKYTVLCVIVLALLGWSCATKPIIEKSQFTYQHSTYTVLLDPSKPSTSPEFEIAISLVQMEYPSEQAGYIQEVLYAGAGLDEYTEEVLRYQRDRYRNEVFDEGYAAGKEEEAYHWYYSETVSVTRFESLGMVIYPSESASTIKPSQSGIVLERNIQTSSGGPTYRNKQFFNIDLDGLNVLKLSDLFVSFQEEQKLRDIVYDELRKYSKLERRQELSEGIFFSDNPELSFNFFITDEGLGLYWGSGQIAPFSCGDIQVVLPWQIIRPLMLYTGIELLTKFNVHLFI